MESNRESSRPLSRQPDTVVLAGCASEFVPTLRDTLEAAGFTFLQGDAPADLVAAARARQPSLVLLDETTFGVMLPDGATVLESLKTASYTSPIPVVVLLPAGSGEDAQLDAFRRGADDCLVRPESPALLRAKILAAARRYTPPGEQADILTAEGLTIDLRARKVTVADRGIALTRKEFDLLTMLIRRRGNVVYTTHLYHSVWGYGDSSPVDAHTVKVHVSSLRGKLGEALARKIVNLPGLGYRFDD